MKNQYGSSLQKRTAGQLWDPSQMADFSVPICLQRGRRKPIDHLMGVGVETLLSEEVKMKLLALARDALHAAAERRQPKPLDLSALPEILQKRGASFVTLTKDYALRGCIGTLEARLPLAEDVRQHAMAAALHDFRFAPVTADEVDHIQIEISVLNQPEKLEYRDAEELLQLLRPGNDGVIISDGLRRATFLPQVWEKIASPSMFLTMLCEKAGLPSDAWKRGHPDVYVYQVETIHEGKPPLSSS
jgi:AmmeMemoRadiSam system protein A